MHKRLIFILAAIVFGCFDMPTLEAQSRKDLHIEVVNKTGQQLQNICVLSGKTECGFGVLAKDSRKAWLFFEQPLQTNAVVMFDGLGGKKEFKVSLVGAYPAQKEGTVVFTIHATNTVVSFRGSRD